MPETILTKQCKVCKKDFPLTNYNKARQYYDSYCKHCRKLYGDKRIEQKRGFPVLPRPLVIKTTTKNYKRWKGKYTAVYLSAKRRNIEFSLTPAQIAELYKDVTHCPYCNKAIDGLATDGTTSIDRKDT